MDNKLTIQDIITMKRDGEKISMLTAYDAGFAGLVDGAGIDMVLVGDSLGMVLLGYDSTIPVTMEEMLHHCRAASRCTAAFGEARVRGPSSARRELVRNAG